MFQLKDLTTDIEKAIEAAEQAQSRDLNPDWITQAVMDMHPDIDGEDASFYRACARPHVRDLAGFERLQERYLIDVGGKQVARRIEDLTDEQLDSKEAELNAMSAGCSQHAAEIRRYKAERRQAA